MATARGKGAAEAAASAYRVREVSVQRRDGKLERINEATTRGLFLQLYVDGRYSAVSTNDLRPGALDAFIAEAVALARALERDPFRALPAPALYLGQAEVDLRLEDPRYAAVGPETRRRIVRELEEAARSVAGREAILSVTTTFEDSRSETARVNSNGFSGAQVGTAFWMGAEVSVADADGRKPEESALAGSRMHAELPDAAGVGRTAALRALGRLGSRRGESSVLTMAVDARAAGRLVAGLLGPLTAQALQQRCSFLEGRKGTAFGSPLLQIADDPLIVKGFGSRLFDGEGIAARRMPLFSEGVLESYYVDTYYGKKLSMPPTTAGPSNVVWKLGEEPPARLITDMGEGILVTGFLGGNVNGTTGDFSLGIQGFRVRAGQAAEPVGEMNVSGNQVELWSRLVAVGNDPYPYSALRTPTLVFEAMQFAGV